MTPERWREIEELYHGALARPAGERAAFLDAACPDDDALRLEVESLLGQPASAGGILERSALPAPPSIENAGDPVVMIGRTLGGYHLKALLGAGGMGEVYRARDTKLGRDVAIKILPTAFTSDPDRLARFEREARILAALNHPNICAIYGLERPGGIQFLVLELAEGATLAARIADVSRRKSRDAGLPLGEALAIARQIAEALEAAHERGIIHRDLKPANITVTPDGLVKVVDFGIAKSTESADAGQDGERSDATRAGVILGTATYMSPEQAAGKPVDRRTDIWAFGVVLFEMIAGRRPFGGESVSETLASVLKTDPDWSALPSAVSPDLRRLLRRCLEKDPRRRLQSIADARVQIEDLSIGETEGSPLAVEAPRLSRTGRTLPWIVASGLAVALVLSVWAPWRNEPQPASFPMSTALSNSPSLANSVATQYGGSFALSPNGERIVFVAQEGTDGTPRLYMRRLDRLEATPLWGTEGALTPFFSPDGRFIGFHSDRELKTIAVAGGAPAPRADWWDSRGASWGEDGAIVLSNPRTMRLLRVLADGKSDVLAAVDTGEAIQAWPDVLPGGKGVLYTSNTVGGAFNDATLVIQPPAGKPIVVQRGGYHGRYVRSGHLVYIHDGTLFALPFDLARLEGTFPAVPVVRGVAANTITGGAEFSISASGTLVYLPGPVKGSDIPIAWMDREGRSTPLGIAPANWSNLRFSADGTKLALEVKDGPADIWVYDLAAAPAPRRPLNSGTTHNQSPVFTPDGGRLTFSSAGANAPAPQNLYWQGVDGHGLQRLTESPNSQRPGSWDPTGRFLIFEERVSSGKIVPMLLKMDGDEAHGWKPGKPTPFLRSPTGGGSNPVFSPDGQWIAYVSAANSSDQVFNVYVRPFTPATGADDTPAAVLVGQGLTPTWSRTAHELYFGRMDGQIMVARYTVEHGVFRAEPPQPWSSGRFQFRGSPTRMFDVDPKGDRIALAPSVMSIGSKLDNVILVSNFFDELRRLAPATTR